MNEWNWTSFLLFNWFNLCRFWVKHLSNEAGGWLQLFLSQSILIEIELDGSNTTLLLFKKEIKINQRKDGKA